VPLPSLSLLYDGDGAACNYVNVNGNGVTRYDYYIDGDDAISVLSKMGGEIVLSMLNVMDDTM
jgi:hypothetical protein